MILDKKHTIQKPGGGSGKGKKTLMGIQRSKPLGSLARPR